MPQTTIPHPQQETPTRVMGEPPIPEEPERLRALLKDHSIIPEEYERIKQALGRTPTLTELGIYSVMWSEHCSYKSSRVHLKRLPTRSKLVVQGPGENAGIIDIGDGWACAFKIESHNHPSYIEPFQGAATGVGGILRDIFTMGARPLAVMDALRFGPVKPSASSALDDATIHKNQSILEGVVSGIAHYGNCFGVPNLGGETKFESCYSGNPLVNAFALGLVRRDEIFYAKAAGVGNPVIYVGAKTGRDGIHGATMASEEFKEGSEQKRPNVQVGDPFMEKLLLEACLEAMHTGAIVGIQDMGAAGLTCSTCEMGARGAVGVEIELDLVPQRETGMSAYEIMLSESQERMLLVAEKGREDEVFSVFRKWGLDAVTVGQVIPYNFMRVLKGGKIIAEIPNTSLTDDAPLYRRPIGEWKSPLPATKPAGVSWERRNHTADLKQLLASLNICSKHWIFEQYDTMVQTNTVAGPGGDGGVMRIKGTKRGLAMALDGNGRWCYLNPKLGAQHAVAEACRKVAITGATPVAATNNLNFGNPEKPPIMRQLSDAVDGIAEACTALGTPITGGNVSLYNETLGEGIYPTPVLGIVGIIQDVSKAVTSHFAAPGEEIALLAPHYSEDDAITFGSSEYAKEIVGTVWGQPPALDLQQEAALQRCIITLVDAGLVHSTHDVADGGLAVTVAESCFQHSIGAQINVPVAHDPALALFGEAASRIVISCDSAHLPDIERIAASHNLQVHRLGKTGGNSLEIRVNGETAIRASVSELKSAWKDALVDALGVSATLEVTT